MNTFNHLLMYKRSTDYPQPAKQRMQIFRSENNYSNNVSKYGMIQPLHGSKCNHIEYFSIMPNDNFIEHSVR